MAVTSSVESRLEEEQGLRQKRLDQLATIGALLLLTATFWLAWPDLKSSFSGERSVLQSLGAPLIVLAWALVMQDLPRMTAGARSRIGAATTVAWLPLILMGTWSLQDGTMEMVGGIILIIVAAALFRVSRTVLQGSLVIIRYRGVMGGLGCVVTLSLVVASIPQAPELYLYLGILTGGAVIAFFDWSGGEEDKELRKEFRRRLNKLEFRILELRETGAGIDQAASLVMTAGEEGYLDLNKGMRLLDEAEDDIERTLRFTEDVEDVRAEVARSVGHAEEIAPLAKRPARAMTQGDRELELGSLREAEQLFRQAKIRAEEVIEWWERAETAITTAKRMLSEVTGQEADSLRSILKEAETNLMAENPKKAFEFATGIPEQLTNVGTAVENAGHAVELAQAALGETDGMETSQWEQRLKQASQALEDGEHSLARGLCDGIVREVSRERAAMDDVRRGLRQRKKLVARFIDRSDADEWQSRLNEIKTAADEQQWSHAATLLERLTSDLDSQGKALDEAEELLGFVQDEWRILRNQLDAGGITVKDQHRRAAEAAVATAVETHGQGRIEDCLAQLGEADSVMEKLRRRL